MRKDKAAPDTSISFTVQFVNRALLADPEGELGAPCFHGVRTVAVQRALKQPQAEQRVELRAVNGSARQHKPLGLCLSSASSQAKGDPCALF